MDTAYHREVGTNHGGRAAASDVLKTVISQTAISNHRSRVGFEMKSLFDDLTEQLERNADPESVKNAFHVFATHFFTDVCLSVFGVPLRVLEIEFYWNSVQHPDPFVHCHPIQAQFGSWYLHRVGTGFRGGSFKGIDFTFGGKGAFGGILVRTIKTADGTVICGPSLCVDKLLAASKCDRVSELHDQIGNKPIWDKGSPLRFQLGVERCAENVYCSPRVGLSGARISDQQLANEYADREYRFFVSPRAIKKGRPEMIRALLGKGYSIAKIHELTGSPVRTIAKYKQR